MRRRKNRPWERWSPTKLDLLLFKCPLSFYFEYVEMAKDKVKQGIAKIFGAAIHHMLENFFKQEYKSLAKFRNAWIFYWLDYTLKMKYGIRIRMKNPDDPQMYLATGIRILTTFWHKNLPYRDGRLPRPEVEKRFSLQFKAHKITGKIDRIQPVNNGIEIWDYKTGWKKPSKQELLRNPQFTFYNLAWYKKTGQNPIRMRLVHLFSGEDFIIPPRTQKDYETLALWLDEATVYVENILNPRPRNKWKDIVFNWLNPEDIERKYFPKRPGNFCRICDYERLCQNYHPIDNLRKRWTEIELEKRFGPDPGHIQFELPMTPPKAKRRKIKSPWLK